MESLEELNDFIESKNQEVYDLKKKIKNLEWKNELETIKWQIPFSFTHDNLTKDLPYPRLEMRLEKHGYQSAWTYGIVCRRYEDDNNETQVFIPLNRTTTSASVQQIMSYDNKLPRRDGVHIMADSMAFGFKAFFICQSHGFVEEITNELGDYQKELAEKRLTKLAT